MSELLSIAVKAIDEKKGSDIKIIDLQSHSPLTDYFVIAHVNNQKMMTAVIDNVVEKAEKAGVQLVACGFSLNKFKVDKTKVPEEMSIVENGILYNFQLQKKGYKSLSL